MDALQRKQVISEEWMIDSRTPAHNISRLRYRATYTDSTLWWLMVQLDLLDQNVLKWRQQR